MAASLSAVILAGCVGDDEEDGGLRAMQTDDLWAQRALPFGDSHDHWDRSQHQDLSTPNFELLGYDSLVSPFLERTASGGLCGDAGDRGDRRIGVVHALSDQVAFTLVDVTDPAAPFQIGEFVLPNTGSRDVALTEDGMFVAIAVSTPVVPPHLPVGLVPDAAAVPEPPVFRRACDGAEFPLVDSSGWQDQQPPGPLDYAPYPPGVMLVSIEDPEVPEIVSYYPLPVLGAHSVTGGELDGTQVIVASVVNLATAASNFWFFTVEETPAGPQLVPGGMFQDSAAAANAPLLNGHNDAWVQVHPGTGQHLAYLANWNQGMAILDISNMANPTVIGRWHDNPSPNADLQSDGTGSVHDAFPMRELTSDGRHYTFIGQEILVHPADTPSGWIKILDTTDPTNPVDIGEWTLPVDVEWAQQLVWSTHYLDYWQDTLFIAHYHAGVWAVDLTNLQNDPYPPAIGAFVPANEPLIPPQDAGYDWTPTVMEMNVLSTGDIVVWDSASGVYVVRFHADHPAPPQVWIGYQ